MLVSVTKAEIEAGMMVVQAMLYLYLLLGSQELKIEFLMLLEVNNSRAEGIVNSCSVGGRTCHMDAQNYFLHELKE